MQHHHITLLSIVVHLTFSLQAVLCGAADTNLDAGKSLPGVWQGTLKVQAIELRVVLHVAEKDDGYQATLDSPDQGAKGIPVDRVEMKDKTVRLELKKLKASFEGTLADDGQTIAGKWTQAGSLPLEFKRLEKEPVYARPQEPKKPYPYAEEEVTYNNDAAGLKLAGTLTCPASGTPAPAVLLISGSGAQDRNESLMGHQPFLVLADYLTRRGIVVLRVDDRGVGGSTGDTMASTTRDLAGDVLAGVAYLQSRKEVDAKRVGLLGHSEGGLVAPLAASTSGDVAFIVMLAGTGVTGEEILYRQGDLIAKAQGADEATLAQSRRTQQRMIEAVKGSSDGADAEKRVRQVADDLSKDVADADAKESMHTSLDAQLKLIVSPWFRYFLSYDPRPALTAVKCRVLAINGQRDLQVDPKQNLPVIATALAEGGNRNVEVRELPGLNHLFQHCQSGSPSDYGKIDETFSPAAMQSIADWILAY